MYIDEREFERQMPDGSQLLSREPEMESSLHYAQLALLVSCLDLFWQERQNYFIGANLTIYFSRQQLKNRDFRGPDLFLVKGTDHRHRNSWVVWEEDGRYPNLIIELLSNSTAQVDRTIKKQLYQDRFHTPEYFWFSPESFEFQGFRLGEQGYREIQPTIEGWRWSQELDLYLGVVDGQLRYLTAAGELVPTPLEVQQAASQQVKESVQRAEQEAQRAEQEAQRAATLAAKLRELGIDPDGV